MQTDNNRMHAGSAKNESASQSAGFLKTDGGKTKSNAIEVPSIALPKGGGAIKGIDEKFSVNAVNGTASFSIPLPFAPARGASPALSLSYNSGGGNGIFGLGWNVSLPSIKRKTDKGLPKYFDNIDSDVFLFSEAEDLVLVFEKDENGKFIPIGDGGYKIYEKQYPDKVHPTHTIRFYKPRTEGLFARIERWTEIATGEIKWRVITKDNTTTLFGWTEQSRIFDPAVSDGKTRIYEWLPEFVFDDKGNCSQYIYAPDDTHEFDFSAGHNKNRVKDNKLTYTNLYLSKILYGNQTPYSRENNFPVETNYLFSTVFDYYIPKSVNDPHKNDSPEIINNWTFRTDAFSDYKAGFEIRTTKLCKRVLLFHIFEELALKTDKSDKRTLIKSLNFDYGTDTQKDFTFLKSITAFGYIKFKNADDTFSYSKKNLPPTEFTYQLHEWNKDVKTISAENLVHAPVGLDESQYQFTDLFNEGLSGILTEQAGGWYYKHNLGNGEFEHAKLVSPKPSFAGLGSQLQLADLDANGGKQLVNYAAEPKGYFELTDEEEWQPFKSFLNLPNINLNDANTRMLDLNGDGKAEILISEDNVFTWYESEGKNGFKNIYHTEKTFDEEAGPAIVFADSTQSIFLADMSGDGLSDIVRIRNGEVCYWPNMGYGKFGAKVLMDDSPVFDLPGSFNPSYLRLADIDGSGTTDIIYLGKNKFACWSNFSGNSFNIVPFEIDAFPDIHNQAKITVTDLLGNGVVCIVWSSPLQKDANAALRYIDLMASKKPHIMIGYKNNMGKEVSMEYKASTYFYLEDKKAGRPWITKLHFPVHCVVKTIVIDHWRKTSFASSYSYHHGFYDHAEREFRGFGRVEQTDIEDFGIFSKGNIKSPYITNDQTLYQPPVKTITWYHTGSFLEQDRILNQFKHEYFAPQSPAFTEHVLPEPELDGFNLTAAEWPEALRACKGMMLRQEVYELDVDTINTPQEKRVKLFSTAFHNCHIQFLQPRGNNRHAIFLVTESEAITYNYELDLVTQPLQPDPRIAHTLNLSTDEYGNVLESVAIAYKRVTNFTDVGGTLPEGTEALINEVQQLSHLAYTQNQFTILDPAITDTNDQHRLPLPCEVKTYELRIDKQIPGLYFTLQELRAANIALLRDIPYHELLNRTASQKRIVENVRILYFKDDLQNPLPFGIHNFLALPFETYKQALTEALLQATLGTQLPSLQQTGETYDAMLHRILPAGGYHFEDGAWWIRSGIAGFNSDAATNFYLPEKYTDAFENTTTLQFDNYNLFIEKSRDELWNETSIKRFDYRVLAPLEVEDINGNLSELVFDILGMPAAMAVKGKINETLGDNLTGVTTEIDEATLIQFFTDAAYNETQSQNFLGNATARYVYYLGQTTVDGITKYGTHPAAVAAITREKHISQLSAGETSPVQIAFQYADGSGTVIAAKAQAEPETEDGPLQWITNGRTILNNKGKPVKQYEPYFTTNHVYAEPDEVGVTPIMYYDAPGRLIRTEMPDGSYSRVKFTPWFMCAYDQNDTLLEPGNVWYKNYSTSPDADKQAAAAQAIIHANTPAQTFLDSLGREVIAIAHNKWKKVHDDGTETIHQEKYRTYTKLDAEGKPLWIKDARGNLVMQYVYTYATDNQTVPTNYVPCYDIAGNLLFQHSMDGGDRWMITDAAGKPFYSWDVNERQLPDNSFITEQRIYHAEYDGLHRPTAIWLTINNDAPALIDKTVYGESLPITANAKAKNLLGKAYQHYDTGGLVTNIHFDFKGNLLHTQKQIAADYKAAVIDWQTGSATNMLEREIFSQQTEYDALNRMTRLYNWHKDDNNVAVYEPMYNKRGLLLSEDIILKTTFPYVLLPNEKRTKAISKITYDAKGQLQRIYYGNGTTTRYSYDPQTFRLQQLRTTRINFDSPFPTATGLGNVNILQNLYYTYDAVGNITQVYDDAYDPAFFNNQRVEPKSTYQYDALYRLIFAIGRENNALNAAPGQQEKNEDVKSLPTPAVQVLRNYIQEFTYDAVGNIVTMRHRAGNGNLSERWTRTYAYDTSSNRLLKTWTGNNTADAIIYHYDPHGSILNLAKTDIALYMRWDYRDMVQSLNCLGGGRAFYQYDSGKQRIRKIIEKNGSKEERYYLGGMEWYRRKDNGVTVEEIETHHLFAGSQRVLIVEDVISTDNTQLKTGILYRYQYSNHLGSVGLELNADAEIISYEEYHPYGTSAYKASNAAIKCKAKRYRYTGMERDEESGLAYHTARYYLPWLGRWLSADPIGIGDGVNLFVYVSNNPLMQVDQTGFQEKPAHKTDGSKTQKSAPKKIEQKPSITKEAAILDIAPFKPLSTYPLKLTVDDDLMNELLKLQADKSLPPGSGKKHDMERTAQVSQTGVVYPLTKDENILSLGNNNRLLGEQKSESSSPNANNTSKILQETRRDPMVYLPEIHVHTHQGNADASYADIGNAASRKGLFVPKKSMSVGRVGPLNDADAYLFIPTKETSNIVKQLAKDGTNTYLLAQLEYNNTKVEKKSGEADGKYLFRMLYEPALHSATKLGLVVYKYSPEDKAFHRVSAPAISSVHKKR
jgi:RHS repeat-associated protein